MVTSFMQEKKNIKHEYHLLLSGISFYTVLIIFVYVYVRHVW